MRYTSEIPIDYSKIYSDASPTRDPEILSSVKFHFVRWFRVARAYRQRWKVKDQFYHYVASSFLHNFSFAFPSTLVAK